MASTVADVLFERLTAWGVDTIFGLPGDGINGFMEACGHSRIGSVSSRFGMRKRRRSWHAVTPSSLGGLASASPRAGPGRSTS